MNIVGPAVPFTDTPMSRNDRCHPGRELRQGSTEASRFTGFAQGCVSQASRFTGFAKGRVSQVS